MSSFAPSTKRTRTEEGMEWKDSDEFFPGNVSSSCRFTLPFSLTGIPVIPYSPDAAPDNVLCFRHYNPTEVMHTTEPRVATLATAHSPLQCMKANYEQV